MNAVKAVAFDAYGTLFDIASVVAGHRSKLGGRADLVNNLWRVKQLEYTWLRSLMGQYATFWQVSREALDYAFTSAGLENGDLKEDLMQSYLQVSPYTDVIPTLSHLKQAGIPRVILSNGSPEMLQSAAENAKIIDLLDGLLSADSVQVFKPSRAVYQLAVDHFGLPAGEIVFCSSNSWDVAGAASFGLRVVWVNRSNQQSENLPAQPEVQVSSLDALPNLLH